MGEVDPNGKDPHAPGAKLDAGKLRPHLVFGGFANALEQVVKVGTDGAIKYSDNGWKEVPDGSSRYMDALGRHLLRLQSGERFDEQSGSHHLAHIAWNALAVLELASDKQVVSSEEVKYESAMMHNDRVVIKPYPECVSCAWMRSDPSPCSSCKSRGILVPSRWTSRA